eukprot:3576278-Rhodomonas_salina.1
MSGTDRRYAAAIVLGRRYAVSGTEIRYAGPEGDFVSPLSPDPPSPGFHSTPELSHARRWPSE